MMNIWHKLTESAKGSGLVVAKNGKNVGVMTAYEHRSQAHAGKWCYLTELLKLEQENKKLQEKLEIAVNALNTIKQAIEFGFPKRGIKIDTPHTMLLRAVEEKAQEALAKIKEIK